MFHCRGLTKTGQKCKNKINNNQKYCHYHNNNKYNQYGGVLEELLGPETSYKNIFLSTNKDY